MDILTLPDGEPNPHPNSEQHLNQQGLRVEDVPEELKARPQWVLWRYVEMPSGKPKKVAFEPNYTGRWARTNDPSTWGTFEEALEVFEKSQSFNGIGYVISQEDPYIGLDYDDCLDPETGELHEAVSSQIEAIDSYAEISPSGKGLRVFARANKPGIKCSTKNTPWGGEFAMYEHSRFFTITGRVLRGYAEIGEAQDVVDRAYHAAFGEEEEPPLRSAPEGRGNALTNSELIEHARKSKNGERFRRHHDEGDSSGYQSRSEADFAHLADLCFWTGEDEERMVEIFCQSALYLPEKGMGYVRRSARKAIRTHRGGFFRRRKQERPAEVLELVEELERCWWDEPFPGIGGKTLASMLRALIRKGKQIGTIQPGEGLRVSMSVLQLSEIVECHPNTIVNATRRAKDAGILRKDDYNRKDEDSGAFILFDPRLTCGTPKDTCAERVLGGTTSSSRHPVADLTTEHYRWRTSVGKGRERALCALEAFGPQTAEELAERLGWSRARDVRTRYLNRLIELKLVEDRGGVYALPGDYRERQEEVCKTPYSTVQLRAKRIRSSEGRRLTVVAESGMVASQEDRGLMDRERNKRKRQAFRKWLEERRRARDRRPEEDREITELLNSWAEERAEAHGTISELEPLSDPQVVDGVVRHDPECGCAWCEDEPPGVGEVA